MPELPEVETIRKDLTKVLNRTFVGLWTDTKKIIKKDFKIFKKTIKGAKIKRIERKGKNLIFSLSNDYYLLIHLKLTGYLLYDQLPKNQYLRVIFYLDNKKTLALSDLRKFAKIELLSKKELTEILSKIGPDPLEISFEEFKGILPKKGNIKKVLMNQKIISGIGNIYADEILWESKIHPLKDISLVEKKILFKNIKQVLKKGIKLRGASVSDYKDLQGEKGTFDQKRKVYRKEGRPCPRCQKKIERIKINNRSSHFCSFCQKL